MNFYINIIDLFIKICYYVSDIVDNIFKRNIIFFVGSLNNKKMKKEKLKNYFSKLIDSIDFPQEFDFDATIRALPNFEKSLIRIIKHPEEIDKIMAKESEFQVWIPEEEKSLLFFEPGKEYKVIIWSITRNAPSKKNLILKMAQEGELILCGIEGLKVIEKYQKENIPFGKAIISFLKKDREVLNSFCRHENSDLVQYGSIGFDGTIISKRNLIISFYSFG